MSGTLLIIRRRLLHEWPQTAILVGCLATVLLLPLAGRLLLDRYGEALRRRAAETPLVVGAAGSRFDLVLAALYFRPAALPTLPMGVLDAIDPGPGGRAIPLHLGFTARGHPIVGTELDYLAARGLRVAEGGGWRRLGDCVLGAEVAAQLGVAVGDRLFSDPRDAYDLAGAAPVALRVVGVLAPSGSADDAALFVDLATAWMLEGFLHGHAEPVALPEAMVFGREGERFHLAEGIREHYEVTEENLGSFHLHGDISEMPIGAVLLFPTRERDRTLVEGRLAGRGDLQAIRPAIAVEELLGTILRVKALFDAITLVLAATTVLLVGLVVALSLRARRGELRSMAALGASRGTLRRLVIGEILAVLLIAALCGLVGAWAVDRAAPDLARWIRPAPAGEPFGPWRVVGRPVRS
jgi:putative ABC transport system permease protein